VGGHRRRRPHLLPRFFHFAVVGLNADFGADEHLMNSLRRDGYVLPTVEAAGSFEAPLRAGDTAQVETTVIAVGEASLSVSVTVERAGDGDPAATVEATFVLVDESFEATPLPEWMRACVEARGDAS
jgi:acyl-CoA thioester hydrolase